MIMKMNMNTNRIPPSAARQRNVGSPLGRRGFLKSTSAAVIGGSLLGVLPDAEGFYPVAMPGRTVCV